MNFQDIVSKGTTEPLVTYERGGFVEGLHRGAISVVTADGTVLSHIGSPELGAIIRSSAKPFQLLTILASGAVEEFGLVDSELAVAASSHSGEVEHLREVRSMIKKIGLKDEQLHCGVHGALFPHIAKMHCDEKREPNVVDNNCSGKHSSMIAACMVKGWDTSSYELISHELQQENLRRTALFAGVDPASIGIAIDGCTVPTFHLPLKASALAYARLADPRYSVEDERDRAAQVFRIMNGNPTLIGGRAGRLESDLMKMFPGKMIAKVGAEGFFSIGIAPGVIHEQGVGISFKIEDGISFNRAADGVVVEALRQLEVVDSKQLESLASYRPLKVMNNCGAEVGDINYRFKLTR